MSSADRLSPKEITALVVLMAEAREIRNPDLNELGVDLSGASRAKVLKLGLVSERKVRRANAFTLTPKGWSAAAHLLAGQDRIAGSSGAALTALIQAVSRGLAHHGLSAEKFFDRGATATADGQSPEAQVRAAYARLAKQPAAWVTLADLRDELGGLSRAEVDATLRGLARTPGVQLIPVANLKSLDQRDKDAALRLGGEDNHVLSIEAA